MCKVKLFSKVYKNQVLLKNAKKDWRAVTCFYLQLQAVQKQKIIKNTLSQVIIESKYKNPTS